MTITRHTYKRFTIDDLLSPRAVELVEATEPQPAPKKSKPTPQRSLTSAERRTRKIRGVLRTLRERPTLEEYAGWMKRAGIRTASGESYEDSLRNGKGKHAISAELSRLWRTRS